MGAGVGCLPAPDQAEAQIDGYMALVAKSRDREVHCWHRAVIPRLCFRELECPAGVPVLVTELCGLVFPMLRNASSLDVRLLATGVALARRRYQRGVE